MPDVKLLQKQLEDHIEVFNAHLVKDQARWEHLVALQETNIKNIADLTVIVETQFASMHEIVEAWEATNGAIKVGATVGRFIKWVGGFGILGALGAWCLEKFG